MSILWLYYLYIDKSIISEISYDPSVIWFGRIFKLNEYNLLDEVWL